MKTLPQDIFNDFENPQIIWEIFGELLDIFDDGIFTAQQVANETGRSTTLINKVAYRLIKHNAIIQVKIDHWEVKHYKLNNEFTGF